MSVEPPTEEQKRERRRAYWAQVHSATEERWKEFESFGSYFGNVASVVAVFPHTETLHLAADEDDGTRRSRRDVTGVTVFLSDGRVLYGCIDPDGGDLCDWESRGPVPGTPAWESLFTRERGAEHERTTPEVE